MFKSLKGWIIARRNVEIDRIAKAGAGDSAKKTTALAAKYAYVDTLGDLELMVGKAKLIIQEEEREAEEMTKYYESKTTRQLNHGGMIRLKSHNHAICKMKEVLKLFEGE